LSGKTPKGSAKLTDIKELDEIKHPNFVGFDELATLSSLHFVLTTCPDALYLENVRFIGV